MKPTEDQLNSASSRATMLTIGIGKEHRLAYGRELIEAWESIRPPCPDCGEAKAALPEWILRGDQAPTITDADISGKILWMKDGVGMFTDRWNKEFPSSWHWMPITSIAALPKRPTPVKVEPTAEDVERAEFEEWAKGEDLTMEVGSDTLYYHVVTRAAFAGWKAARAGR